MSDLEPGAKCPAPFRAESDRMSPTPYDPPTRRHRFDIVAYDQHDAPVLVVEIKRSGDIRSLERLVQDTIRYVSAAARKAPFF